MITVLHPSWISPSNLSRLDQGFVHRLAGLAKELCQYGTGLPIRSSLRVDQSSSEELSRQQSWQTSALGMRRALCQDELVWPDNHPNPRLPWVRRSSYSEMCAVFALNPIPMISVGRALHISTAEDRKGKMSPFAVCLFDVFFPHSWLPSKKSQHCLQFC